MLKSLIIAYINCEHNILISEESITENKVDSAESKDVVEPNSQLEDEPDITSVADASDLSSKYSFFFNLRIGSIPSKR